MDIKGIMMRHGHTTATLAKQMGVADSTVSRLVNGNPTLGKLRELAGQIGCGVWEFFEDERLASQQAAQAVGGETAAPSSVGDDSIATQATKADGGAAAPAVVQQGTPTAGTTLQAALVCPHCHHAIAVTIADAGT